MLECTEPISEVCAARLQSCFRKPLPVSLLKNQSGKSVRSFEDLDHRKDSNLA
jgi:hypothetical protein